MSYLFMWTGQEKWKFVSHVNDEETRRTVRMPKQFGFEINGIAGQKFSRSELPGIRNGKRRKFSHTSNKIHPKSLYRLLGLYTASNPKYRVSMIDAYLTVYSGR